MGSFILGGLGIHVVTNADGTISVLAGSPIAETTVLQAALLADLVTDSDAFHAPAIAAPVMLLPDVVSDADAIHAAGIANTLQYLLLALLTDADAIHAASTARVLRPLALVLDLDSLFQPVTVDRQKPGREQRVRPDRLNSDDAVFASLAEFFDRTLKPALIPGDDSFLAFSNTRFLLPALKLDGDGILASDVGWQVIAELTTDEDAVFSDIRIDFCSFPETFFDEDSVETYPFRVQQVSGGIPVPPREGVLTGSIKRAPQLTGSIGHKRLTGSHASGARRLTGSLRAGARRSARR